MAANLKLTERERYWLARHRATAALIRSCFDSLPTKHRNAKTLHALASLTWITHSQTGVADNTKSVVAKALSTLFDKPIKARSRSQLDEALASAGIHGECRTRAAEEVGFTDFFAAYRNTSRVWLTKNIAHVLPIIAAARHLKSDAAARQLYVKIDALPAIPRKVGGPLPAANFLTPLVACLDPRVRSPILNSAASVRAQLARLGLSGATLAEQFDGFVKLLHQRGIEDALFLDTCAHKLETVAPKPASPRSPSKQPSNHKRKANSRNGDGAAALHPIDSSDVAVISAALSTKRKQRHHQMTNGLLALCSARDLAVEYGSKQSCRYDALIRSYVPGRDLLIEAKSSAEVAEVRLAIGQLMDYRRQLTAWPSTDIAVLLPAQPCKHVREFLADVGAKLLVFDSKLKHISGDVTL